MHSLISIAYGLIGLGILVIIHELGHFIIAKLFKVRVEEFSIGFGKPLLRYEKNGTLYKIAAVPLGGYCKMAGEEPDDKSTGASDELYSKPPGQRLAIVMAGSVANYIFGLLLLVLILAIGIKQPTYSSRITVLDKITLAKNEIPSPAKTAGLLSGDEIIRINNVSIRNWAMLQKQIYTTGDRDMNLIRIKREGREMDIRIKSAIDPDTGLSVIGVTPFVDNTIKSLVKDGPAMKAGMKPGDRIIRIDRQLIRTFDDLKNYLSRKPGQAVSIKIMRKGIALDFQLTTQNVDGRGFMGAEFSIQEEIYVNKSKNLLYALPDAFKRSLAIYQEIIYGLKLMVSGQIKIRKAVSGPVKIVFFTGETAQRGGLLYALSTLAYISLALAFFNLLPIPAVDGSYVLIFLFEALIKRKLNYNVIKVVQYVSLMLLLGLMVLISINDIYGLFQGSHKIKNAADYLKIIMS
ncbi:MAG: RIP metalloprotease RseP [bacterium]|nr:RIP metalloprotease RseP [bacterium]